jgi:hypothetical protein
VVEPEEVTRSRIQIVNVHRVAGDIEAELVRFAVDVAALEAFTCESHGETSVVVVPAIVAALRHGRATELTAPDDDGVVEETAFFEIAHESSARFLGDAAVVLESFGQFAVLIPTVVEELDETGAAFEQASGEETVAGIARFAMIFYPMQVEHGLRFIGKVHEFGCAGLEAEGLFVTLNARGDCWISAFCEGDFVEFAQGVEQCPLRGGVETHRVREVGNGIAFVAKADASERVRQKAAAVVACAAADVWRASQDHVHWQVLTLATETVERPGTEAWPAELGCSGVQHFCAGA